MPGDATREITQHLRQLFNEGTLTGLSDGQLLDRFRETGDEMAFTALVARHGPMVLEVCGAVLRNPADAEDAFQAAFLVLARRAGSLRSAACVGGWLYRVSRRIAIRASIANRSRRDDHPLSTQLAGTEGEGRGGNPAHEAIRREVEAMVHEELARLPERDRAVLMLCDLEGISHAAAAQRLRWPLGTVKGRLARARDRLRHRLQRRGANEPVPTLLVPRSPLTDALIQRTATLATAPAGAVPATIMIQVSEALRTMFWMNVRSWALGLGVLGLLAGGVSAVGQGQKGDAQAPNVTATPTPETTPTPEVDTPPKGEQISNVERMWESVRDQATVRAGLELREVELEAQKAAIARLTEALTLYDLTGRLPDLVDQPGADSRPTRSPDEIEEVVGNLHNRLLHKIAEYRRGASSLAFQKLQLSTHEGTRLIRPGDLLTIEILETLPGRPLTGQRIVRPDGTISLGFYGDLPVIGLTRHQIKENLIRHMKKFLNDDVLGLVEMDPTTGKPIAIPPVESDRVLVDDSLNYQPAHNPATYSGR